MKGKLIVNSDIIKLIFFVQFNFDLTFQQCWIWPSRRGGVQSVPATQIQISVYTVLCNSEASCLYGVEGLIVDPGSAKADKFARALDSAHQTTFTMNRKEFVLRYSQWPRRFNVRSKGDRGTKKRRSSSLSLLLIYTPQ